MRILLAVSLTALLALSAVGSASAEGGATLKFTATTTLTSTGGTTYSGPITSPQLGKGTATYVSKVTETAVTAKFTVKLKGGTLKGTTTGTLSGGTTPDDPVILAGSGKVTSGTRDFKGTTGSFTYAGKSNADGTITLKLKGKLTA
jgi:hypothetical protein